MRTVHFAARVGDKLCSPDRCVGARAAQERYEILKAMNLLAKTRTSTTTTGHWSFLMKPMTTSSERSRTTFSDAVRCFINHFSKYAKEGGLYLGGARYPD